MEKKIRLQELQIQQLEGALMDAWGFEGKRELITSLLITSLISLLSLSALPKAKGLSSSPRRPTQGATISVYDVTGP
eukprot:750950-Hanusia_phi.AAC.1